MECFTSPQGKVQLNGRWMRVTLHIKITLENYSALKVNVSCCSGEELSSLLISETLNLCLTLQYKRLVE